MISPTRKPQEFGFKAGDFHLLANGVTKTLTAYSYEGKKLWVVPCLCQGIGGNWRVSQGDTPPSLYKIGAVYNDVATHGVNAAYDRTLLSYGWISFDLVDLEGREDNSGRAGIMIHGGGKACGWPGAWSPKQPLYQTLGCVRCHNVDLRDKILLLVRQGTVFVSVYQSN